MGLGQADADRSAWSAPQWQAREEPPIGAAAPVAGTDDAGRTGLYQPSDRRLGARSGTGRPRSGRPPRAIRRRRARLTTSRWVSRVNGPGPKRPRQELPDAPLPACVPWWSSRSQVERIHGKLHPQHTRHERALPFTNPRGAVYAPPAGVFTCLRTVQAAQWRAVHSVPIPPGGPGRPYQGILCVRAVMARPLPWIAGSARDA